MAILKCLLLLSAVLSVNGQINFPGGGSGGQGRGRPGSAGGQCTGGTVCQTYVACAPSFIGREASAHACALGQGQSGICCGAPTEEPAKPLDLGSGLAVRSGGQGTFDNAFISNAKNEISLRSFTPEETNQAGTEAQEILVTLRRLDSEMLNSGNVIAPGGPGSQHLRFHTTSAAARREGELALQGIEASRNLQRTFGLDTRQTGLGLQQIAIQETALSNICPVRPRCSTPSRGIEYRTADGSCNNQLDTLLGRSNTHAQRILPAVYDDGVWSPRIASVSGRPLAGARDISATVFGIDDNNQFPDDRVTLGLVQWGQFMDHDLTLGAIFFLDEQGNGARCCRNGRVIVPSPHFSCNPIPISANDFFYSNFDQHCMNFVRSLPGPRLDCNLGYAEQINQLTHWVDGSMVYGSTDEVNRELRAFRDGLLRTSQGVGRDAVLPRNTRRDQVFLGGDERVNEAFGLTAMHTIWLRQHNQIASELQRLNPHWDDERLYQEARRIVIAMIQHITYNEFLPAVLGVRYVRNFGLLPRRIGYKNDYDPTINPQINNEFANAAFRFGHTKLPGTWNLLFAENRAPPRQFLLSDNLNNPEVLFETRAVDAFIRAFTRQPAEETDPRFTTEIRGRLFKERGEFFGMDLLALNIQRARDHGIPPYNRYREICGVGAARDWNGLLNEIDAETVQRMQIVYESVDDVDLWTGGISERPLPGAELGPTFVCIIGDQFIRAQRGDRFYYEWGGFPHSFAPDQLQEIRKISLARVFCDNSEAVEAIQPLAMFQPFQNLNPLISCRDEFTIPRIDLRHWAERGFFT